MNALQILAEMGPGRLIAAQEDREEAAYRAAVKALGG
jgi:hypothetical protein